MSENLSFVPVRSALYVPASNQRAIDKTASISADWVIFDLEDSVAPETKASARDCLLYTSPSPRD